MANEEPKKPEGKFSEVARKSREKRAEIERQKRDQDAAVPDLEGNGGADARDN